MQASNKTLNSEIDIPHFIFPKARELIRLKKYIKSPEFKKNLSTSQLAGQWRSIFKGRSMDFDEVRVYQSGDDVRSIDWNISAKTGKLHTQVYKEEKERPIMIMVDYSASMHFGTRKKFKCTLAAEIASILAFSLIDKGDRVGGLIFDHLSYREIKPKMQIAGVLQLIYHLCLPLKKALKNKKNTSTQQKTGLASAIKKLARLSRPGMSVFILSDFLNFSEEAKKYLIRIAEHCSVNLCMIYDPLEASLPQTNFNIQSEGKKFRVISDDEQKLKHQHYFLKRQESVQSFAKRKSFTFSMVSTDDDLAQFNLKMS